MFSPAKSTRSPRAAQLQRKQLDERLSSLPLLDTPRGGWIRTIRQSLGMSMRQLGARLGITAQSVHDLEARETKESISVAKLRDAAEALDCELKIVFVPRSSLEQSVHEQAAAKAHAERLRLLHTMRLEAQAEGVDESWDVAAAISRWRTERSLWD